MYLRSNLVKVSNIYPIQKSNKSDSGSKVSLKPVLIGWLKQLEFKIKLIHSLTFKKNVNSFCRLGMKMEF